MESEIKVLTHIKTEQYALVKSHVYLCIIILLVHTNLYTNTARLQVINSYKDYKIFERPQI